MSGAGRLRHKEVPEGPWEPMEGPSPDKRKVPHWAGGRFHQATQEGCNLKPSGIFHLLFSYHGRVWITNCGKQNHG